MEDDPLARGRARVERGAEVVELAPDELRVSRVIGPLRRTRRFARDRIRRVRVEPWRRRRRLSDPIFGGRPWLAAWGLGGGSVVFDCGGRTHRCGIRLDEAESREVADALRRELQPRTYGVT
jgi:hypothetical protein